MFVLLGCSCGVTCLSIQGCAASSGALATTNSNTAVLVLVLPAPAPVSVSDVSAVLQGGATSTVMDVQPFSGQSSSYLIEVYFRPPSSKITMSLSGICFPIRKIA